MTKAIQTFLEYAKPFSEKHTWLGKKWVVVNKRLTYHKIDQAFTDPDTNYGFFASNVTKLFIIDVDFHQNESTLLKPQYIQCITDAIGAEPSFKVNSPHGVHLYYLLGTAVSTDILLWAVKKRLKHIPEYIHYDILPTKNNALRLPKNGSYVGLSKTTTFADAVEQAEIHNVLALFHDFYDRAKKEVVIQEMAHRKVEEWESIGNGETNEALCDIMPVFASSGLSEEEAVSAFLNKLSPDYHGDIRNSIERRVRWFYSNQVNATFDTDKAIYSKPETVPTDANIMAFFMDYFKDKTPGRRKQLATTYHNFCTQLLCWWDYLEEVYQNPSRCAAWCHYHPSFRFQMAQGAIPTPATVLMTIDKRYYKLMPILVDIGFIQEHNEGAYGVGKYCKAYIPHYGAIMATTIAQEA